MTAELRDNWGRKHDYLRVSVTDRCDLRCVYCMGPEGVTPLDHNEILSYEEISKVVQAGAELGIKSVRLTGGEPLVRKDLTVLVAKIATIPGITDLAMTTNGQLLPELAPQLKKAGLNRVNISLDSLNLRKFREITRCGDLEKTLKGLRAALDCGLKPVKINTVLMKGVNDREIAAFLKLAYEYPVELRFIEYMPLDEHDGKWQDKYLPVEVVTEKIRQLGYAMESSNEVSGFGPAQTYQVAGFAGTIGLIHPVSCDFCANCNRLRLTADGYLKPCLYWQEEMSVKPFLAEADLTGIKKLLQEALQYKRKRHAMERTFTDEANEEKDKLGIVKPRVMSKIGG